MVDGGQTVLTRAARVRPELAGQGIYKTLTDHIKKSVSVETLAFVTDETNAAIDTNSFLRVHRKILERVCERLPYLPRIISLIYPVPMHFC